MAILCSFWILVLELKYYIRKVYVSPYFPLFYPILTVNTEYNFINKDTKMVLFSTPTIDKTKMLVRTFLTNIALLDKTLVTITNCLLDNTSHLVST